MNLTQASHIANQLLTDLYGAIDESHAAIAGSTRRGKLDGIHDIELVVMPRWEVQRDLFQEEIGRFNLLEDRVLSLTYSNGKPAAWRFDEEVKRNGPKLKRLIHADTGTVSELYIVHDVRAWGVLLTIRTGPGDTFSQRLVTQARKLNMHVHEGLLHAHPVTYEGLERKETKCKSGAGCPLVIPCETEQVFFDALKVDWVEPKDRR